MKIRNIGTKPGYRPLTLLYGCDMSYSRVPAEHPTQPVGYAPVVIIASNGDGCAVAVYEHKARAVLAGLPLPTAREAWHWVTP